MMKIAILITVLLTGCATQENPRWRQHMEWQGVQGETRSYGDINSINSTNRHSHTRSASALNITTNSGQVLVVPNYSTGAPMAVIRSGR